MNLLTHFFKLKENHTNIRTELLAGLTTFLTMAYIIFVNPTILSACGMPYGAVFTATCITASFGCILLGLLSNYPVAIAPGLGLNAYFSYMLVQTLGYTWQTALGAVFIAGIIFLLLTVIGVRQWIIQSIPESLVAATTAGIGLFLGLIALHNAGLVISNHATLVELGQLTTFAAAISLIGFFIVAVLDYYRVPGSILLVILFIGLMSFLSGFTHFSGIISTPPSIKTTFLATDLHPLWSLSGAVIIFTFVMVALFDSSGTLLSVLNHTDLLKRRDSKTRLTRALIADSIATIIGALCGTSSATTYLESTTGVRAGGRTGLTAITVGVLFILALGLAPLAKLIPTFASTPALLFIACMMLKPIRGIPWDDLTESVPAAITLFMIPFGFSIANGIGLGFISYVVIKLCCGKSKTLSPAVILLALVFVAYFLR